MLPEHLQASQLLGASLPPGVRNHRHMQSNPTSGGGPPCGTGCPPSPDLDRTPAGRPDGGGGQRPASLNRVAQAGLAARGRPPCRTRSSLLQSGPRTWQQCGWAGRPRFLLDCSPAAGASDRVVGKDRATSLRQAPLPGAYGGGDDRPATCTPPPGHRSAAGGTHLAPTIAPRGRQPRKAHKEARALAAASPETIPAPLAFCIILPWPNCVMRPFHAAAAKVTVLSAKAASNQLARKGLHGRLFQGFRRSGRKASQGTSARAQVLMYHGR